MPREEDLIALIDELLALPTETEWVEFKENNIYPPERIGEYISALSNSACLHNKSEAYLIVGVENETHKVVGTKFDYRKAKGKGAEPLESWLVGALKPVIEFKVVTANHPSGRLVIFFIPPANAGPVKFQETAWIRIGETTKKLSAFQEKEAIIWDRRSPFEDKIAQENVSEEEILELLDYGQYFRLTGERRPKNEDGIIKKLLQEGFLIKRRGNLHISNLGAILLAHDLRKFSNLGNKGIRTITYSGTNRLNAIKDIIGKRGYAVGFENLVSYVQSQIPEPETIRGSLRSTISKYPPNSLREFIANSLVHQDFSMGGQSPMIEIFEDRIEISNPGTALIDPSRFIDHPPKSRNEKLTDHLRRMNICEKRGSGVDRAISEIESAQLPAPKIESQEDSVRVTIYSRKKFSSLTKEDQSRACYLHSCIRYVVSNEALTNDSLCKRLGIAKKNAAIASRIIKDTLRKKRIKPFDPENRSNRYAKYLPFWA